MSYCYCPGMHSAPQSDEQQLFTAAAAEERQSLPDSSSAGAVRPFRGTLCNSCGKLFTGTTAFDKHRTGRYEPLQRRCLSDHEMHRRGFQQNFKQEWFQLPPGARNA